jgi:hypothetical protein
MTKREFRQQLDLYFSLTHHDRPCRVLAERYATIDHEEKTGIALIIYQPEDREWRNMDDGTGIERVSYHGEIRYMVVVDGKTREDGIVDSWVKYAE